MVKLFLIIILALVVASLFTREDVIVLTYVNIEDILKESQYLVIEFYSPDCYHCQQLAPKYAEAAKKLKEYGDYIGEYVVFAKANIQEYPDLVEQYLIEAFPTILFFGKDEPVLYTGLTEVDDIVEWVIKQSGPSAQLLQLEKEVNAWIDQASQSVGVIYYGESDQDPIFKKFLKLAEKNNVLFAYTFNSQVLQKRGITDQNRVIMYKNFEESELVFNGEMNYQFTAWVNQNAVPVVMPLNEQAYQIVFQDGDPTLLLFYSEKDNQEEIELFKSIAKSLVHYGVRFVYLDQLNDSWDDLVDLMQIDTLSLPQLAIMHPKEEFVKYKFSSEFNSKNIELFLKAFKNKSLTPYLKSAKPPLTNDEPVKIVVGSTFDYIVMDNTKDVFVAYYDPDCPNCQAMLEIYEEIAELFKINRNLLFTKFDVMQNDVSDQINVDGLPKLYFYRNEHKENPQPYEEDGSGEFIVSFLKDFTTHRWIDVFASGHQLEFGDSDL